jgi:hypothetical protein
MKIIEFLMNNIFIVVIIFGALASLFGKSGSKKKPGRMPDFGGGGLPRSSNAGEPGNEQEERPLPGPAAGQSVYRTQPQNVREEYETPAYKARETEVLNQTPQVAPSQRTLQQAANARGKAAKAAERNSAPQSALTAHARADDLRRAVVWAEILGPPRSKRPFRK